jgi:hypothetical protein
MGEARQAVHGTVSAGQESTEENRRRTGMKSTEDRHEPFELTLSKWNM